mgnify:CR=1 FL=1
MSTSRADETHDPNLKSWVESANDPATDFPIQNLPLCAMIHYDEDESHRHLGVVIGDQPLSFARIAGWLFAPLVWLVGVPWQDAATAGGLMGTKVILNEFIAYLNLAALPDDALTDRTKLLMLYAMCGFANLSSVGMVIAGVSALAPSRRDEIVQLSLWSLIPGTLSTCMTAAVVGLLPG